MYVLLVFVLPVVLLSVLDPELFNVASLFLNVPLPPPTSRLGDAVLPAVDVDNEPPFLLPYIF